MTNPLPELIRSQQSSHRGGQALIVIPARAGSKGVPRKNLRPLLGRPLITYAISAATKVMGAAVVVSTDDDEIALLARRLGVDVVDRPSHLAGDAATIDEVVAHAVDRQTAERKPDVVVTVQPTSPLVSHLDIEGALALLETHPRIDTVISATEDRHLRWTIVDGRPIPEYSQRVNRQYLPVSFRENGAVVACRLAVLASGTRIGKNVEIMPIPPARAVDIDSDLDFQICEALLCRRRVVISVVGHADVGTGHVKRGLLLAHHLIGHDVRFLCEEQDSLAQSLIASENYPITVSPNGGRVREILQLDPDLVISDVLDTEQQDIRPLKDKGIAVVAFEDLGPGAAEADLVINALYPHPSVPDDRVKSGPDFFCLRDEFLHAPRPGFRETAERLLITFGGVDEANLTLRALRVACAVGRQSNIQIDVVVGPGYQHLSELELSAKELGPEKVRVIADTRRISDYMTQADVAITSGGRTVLELVALAIPTIVICQNAREVTHLSADSRLGVRNLGIHSEVTEEALRLTLEEVLEGPSVRLAMVERMKQIDLRAGTRRVTQAINELLEVALWTDMYS